jgi:hypothetical protein
MKKDIEFPKVEGIKIAIVKENTEGQEAEWAAYIINDNPFEIENVVIASKGYGKKGDEEQKTSTLRHVFGKIEGKTHEKIEPISEEVFHLTNEYWVSYYIGTKIFDKKFIFLPDSIKTDNLISLKAIGKEGVLHL